MRAYSAAPFCTGDSARACVCASGWCWLAAGGLFGWADLQHGVTSRSEQTAAIERPDRRACIRAAVAYGKSRPTARASCNQLRRLFALAAVSHQVRDRADFELVLLREIEDRGQTHHAAVV